MRPYSWKLSKTNKTHKYESRESKTLMIWMWDIIAVEPLLGPTKREASVRNSCWQRMTTQTPWINKRKTALLCVCSGISVGNTYICVICTGWLKKNASHGLLFVLHSLKHLLHNNIVGHSFQSMIKTCCLFDLLLIWFLSFLKHQDNLDIDLSWDLKCFAASMSKISIHPLLYTCLSCAWSLQAGRYYRMH